MIQNISELWRRASLVQRVVLMAAGLGCAGAVAILVNWAVQPEMTLLYRDLDPDSAGKIVDKLRDEKVHFELRSGGTSIYVPVAKKDVMRLLLAGQGLPSGGNQGYRILDDEQIGLSPERQRVNYYRAIEGELCKTIEAIEGVDRARVHVVRPRSRLFAGASRQASASVMIRMRSGQRLTPGQVAAVTHLIAGAVEGLSQENVVVADGKGNLLAGRGNNSDAVAGRAGGLFELQTRVEDYFARKIEQMLLPALGPGRTSVKVSAEIETTSIIETVETVDAEGTLIKERTDVTTGSGGKGGTGGNTSTENEYSAGKKITVSEKPAGVIKSLSVTAFVDLSASGGSGGDANAPAGEKLTKEEIEQAIRTAIGEQGVKSVTVVDHPFVRAEVAEELEEEGGLGSQEFLLEMGRRVSLGVLVFGVLVVLFMFRGKKSSKAVEAQAAAALPAGAGAMAPALAATAAAPTNLLAAGTGQPDAAALREGISRALQQNPEDVKRLFLSWADSDRGQA